MVIDPSRIQLTSDQQAYIARQAELTGMPWKELLNQFVPVQSNKLNNSETAFEAAKQLGLIGGVRGEAKDLASNPQHLEGFGE